MPVYDYVCAKCNKEFSVVLTIKAHDTEKVTCPECKSEKVEQLFKPFFVKTSKKS
ncbi:MAG TPA: zinc ribbon domain-containing protein [Candidatus Latescibacteria bacterium]|nr:zinc ribbon domain-containing protein [Candidatus Latescibacterota bacterium]